MDETTGLIPDACGQETAELKEVETVTTAEADSSQENTEQADTEKPETETVAKMESGSPEESSIGQETNQIAEIITKAEADSSQDKTGQGTDDIRDAKAKITSEAESTQDKTETDGSRDAETKTTSEADSTQDKTGQETDEIRVEETKTTSEADSTEDQSEQADTEKPETETVAKMESGSSEESSIGQETDEIRVEETKTTSEADSTQDKTASIHLNNQIIMYSNETLSESAQVYYGLLKSEVFGDQKIAVKYLPYNEQNVSEIKLFRDLGGHPNVVSLFHSDIYRKGPYLAIYVAMELCQKMNLWDRVMQSKEEGIPFDPELSMSYAKQLAEVVRFLHEREIAYRDMKPQNVLVSLNGKRVKIADFSLSVKLNGSETNAIIGAGTDGYRPPETYSSRGVTLEGDIYSLAVVLYFIWSYGCHPFGDDPDDWNSNIKKNRDRDLSQLLIPDKDSAKHLLDWMLQMDPKKRPTAKQVLKHRLFGKSSEARSPSLPTSQVAEKKEEEPSKEIVRGLSAEAQEKLRKIGLKAVEGAEALQGALPKSQVAEKKDEEPSKEIVKGLSPEAQEKLRNTFGLKAGQGAEALQGGVSALLTRLVGELDLDSDGKQALATQLAQGLGSVSGDKKKMLEKVIEDLSTSKKSTGDETFEIPPHLQGTLTQAEYREAMQLAQMAENSRRNRSESPVTSQEVLGTLMSGPPQASAEPERDEKKIEQEKPDVASVEGTLMSGTPQVSAETETIEKKSEREKPDVVSVEAPKPEKKKEPTIPIVSRLNPEAKEKLRTMLGVKTGESVEASSGGAISGAESIAKMEPEPTGPQMSEQESLEAILEEEQCETLMKDSKYVQALLKLDSLIHRGRNELSTQLMTIKCNLHLGRVKQAKDSIEIIKQKMKMFSRHKMLEIKAMSEDSIKKSSHIEAILLLRCLSYLQKRDVPANDALNAIEDCISKTDDMIKEMVKAGGRSILAVHNCAFPLMFEMLDDLRGVEGAYPDLKVAKLAVSLNNIGGSYHEANEYHQTLKYRGEGLELMRQHFGANACKYRILASLLHNNGTANHYLGNYEEAESLYLQSIEAAFEALDFDSDDAKQASIINTMENLERTRVHINK